MKPGYSFFILLGFIMFLSCEKELGPDDLTDHVYFNSFEFSSDTIGWIGISSNDIIEEAPESGGLKSLRVSGGCVIPHASYSIGLLTEECSIVLQCWGKNLSNGGSVTLHIKDGPGIVFISVDEESWTHYISKDTLNCPVGSELDLELISGGFLSSSMLIDLIEIKKVNH